MLKDFFLLAGQSILHRRMRSWLTVIGVFIGITAVVALISVGLGLERTIQEQVAGVFGVDTFMVVEESAFGRGPRGGSAQEYSLDLAFLRTIEGVRVAAAVRRRTAFVQGQPTEDGRVMQGFLPVIGLSPELISDFQSFIGELNVQPGGRLFQQGDFAVATLGSDIARRLGVGVGDTILIAGEGTQELDVTIIGILEPRTGSAGGPYSVGADDDTISVPYEMMETLWGTADDVLVTLVRIEPGYDVDIVASDAEQALKARGSDISTITYTDISSAIGEITSTISAVLAGIAGISLLVGGVGVMNTMFTSVLERTKEIGVMKAVGAKNSHVLLIFLIESGLMGLVGGMVGTVLGLSLSAAASSIIARVFEVSLIVVVSPSLILITLAGAFSLGAVAGLWPAWRASKLQVVDALRYE